MSAIHKFTDSFYRSLTKRLGFFKCMVVKRSLKKNIFSSEISYKLSYFQLRWNSYWEKNILFIKYSFVCSWTHTIEVKENVIFLSMYTYIYIYIFHTFDKCMKTKHTWQNWISYKCLNYSISYDFKIYYKQKKKLWIA